MTELKKEKGCLGFLYLLEVILFQVVVVQLIQGISELEVSQAYLDQLDPQSKILLGNNVTAFQEWKESVEIVFTDVVKESSHVYISTFALTFFSAVNLVLAGVQVFLVYCFAGFALCGEFYLGMLLQRLWSLFKVIFCCVLVLILNIKAGAVPLTGVDTISLLLIAYSCYQFLHVQITEGWVFKIVEIASENTDKEVFYQPVNTAEDDPSV